MFLRGRQKQANIEFYEEEQVRRVLEACGIRVESDVESDFIIYCPYHNNHRTPAAEVSKETGQFYCFGCQESKNLAELVMYASKRTYFEAVRLIDSKKRDIDILESLDKIMSKDTDEFLEYDTETIARLNAACLNSSRAATYLMGRGITKSSVERYMLGYSEKQDMITIPVTAPNGMYVGFVARSIEGKDFKNSTGLPRSKTLFNISNAKRYDRIFVVESSFDAIRIEQVGGHAVATLGASINRRQKELLKKYFRSIILVSDNDDAGRVMRGKLKEYFGHTLIAANLPEEVKDVSDLDDGRLIQFIHQFDDELGYILQ